MLIHYEVNYLIRRNAVWNTMLMDKAFFKSTVIVCAEAVQVGEENS